jgi:putative transcriptional regulator
VKINHHLDDATIIAYAAGTLGEAHGFAVATHLAYCDTCRQAVRQAEALGGEILAEQDGAAVSDMCRAATFASLDAMGTNTVRSATISNAGELPQVLRGLIGGEKFADLPWKKKAPGVATIELPLSAGSKTHLQLLRIGPGREMPEHGHGGEELTVILQGSYSDHTGRYCAGDVADLDTDIEHQPKVDSDIDCICLVATEAPTRFKSMWARIAQPLIGI